MKPPRFLYPQHPKSGILISPHQLDDYEKDDIWIAQLKYQGSNAIIWVYNDDLMMWNRQGEPFTTYTITQDMRDCFKKLNLKNNTEYVLVGELLHTKAKSKITGKQAVDNTVVLFDVLYAGKYLINETIEERLKLLDSICKTPSSYDKDKQALVVCKSGNSQIWMAETFQNEFSYRFWSFVDDENGMDRYPLIEGLVLKMKGSKNIGFGTKPTDVNWMVRCRKKKEKVYNL